MTGAGWEGSSCSRGSRFGVKREGRGQECMGTDLGMWQKEWESERDRKQTGYIFLPAQRRFIVRTTIVAFPTVTLLQRVGILYRRPLLVSKWRTKSIQYFTSGQMRISHTHTHRLKLGIDGHTHTPRRSTTVGRAKNTDLYLKQSQMLALSYKPATWMNHTTSSSEDVRDTTLGPFCGYFSETCYRNSFISNSNGSG